MIGLEDETTGPMWFHLLVLSLDVTDQWFHLPILSLDATDQWFHLPDLSLDATALK
jgi:hypothetical protein